MEARAVLERRRLERRHTDAFMRVPPAGQHTLLRHRTTRPTSCRPRPTPTPTATTTMPRAQSAATTQLSKQVHMCSRVSVCCVEGPAERRHCLGREHGGPATPEPLKSTNLASAAERARTEPARAGACAGAQGAAGGGAWHVAAAGCEARRATRGAAHHRRRRRRRRREGSRAAAQLAAGQGGGTVRVQGRGERLHPTVGFVWVWLAHYR
jgi:hypothetical protein